MVKGPAWNSTMVLFPSGVEYTHDTAVSLKRG